GRSWPALSWQTSGHCQWWASFWLQRQSTKRSPLLAKTRLGIAGGRVLGLKREAADNWRNTFTRLTGRSRWIRIQSSATCGARGVLLVRVRIPGSLRVRSALSSRRTMAGQLAGRKRCQGLLKLELLLISTSAAQWSRRCWALSRASMPQRGRLISESACGFLSYAF